jgi:hypothetical protein
MKRPGKTVIGNFRDGPGYKILQSGYWDDNILCDKHEALLGSADKYGIEFCRQFVDHRKNSDGEVDIPNPHPSQLVDFASACVWRMAVSRTSGAPAMWLGPYAQKLADRLYGNGDFEPSLLISRHGLHLESGKEHNIGTLPYRYFEQGLRFWRFICTGLVFDLKLDNRPAPPALAIFAVNDADKVYLHPDLPQSILNVPGLASAHAQMTAPRERYKRG